MRSATALKDIYSVNANVKRSQVYASTAHFFGGTPSSNTTPDMKEHAFRRRVNVRALSAANIKGMEEQILKNIRLFCETLVGGAGEGWSSPHNMSKLVGYLISDIMGDVTFSKSHDMLKKPDNRDLLTSLPQAVAGIHLVNETQRSLTFQQRLIMMNRWDICPKLSRSGSTRSSSATSLLVLLVSPISAHRLSNGASHKRTAMISSRLYYRRETIKPDRASRRTSLSPRPDFSPLPDQIPRSLPRQRYSSIFRITPLANLVWKRKSAAPLRAWRTSASARN